MKKKTLNARLLLKKKVISALSHSNEALVLGGNRLTMPLNCSLGETCVSVCHDMSCGETICNHGACVMHSDKCHTANCTMFCL